MKRARHEHWNAKSLLAAVTEEEENGEAKQNLLAATIERGTVDL